MDEELSLLIAQAQNSRLGFEAATKAIKQQTKLDRRRIARVPKEDSNKTIKPKCNGIRKGLLKIIADATGYSSSMAYQVHQGKKNNAVIEELIMLSVTDRKKFAERLQEERSITQQVYA